MKKGSKDIIENEDLLRRVRETIDKHFMLSGGERVLIGLSGGPDSVCLLHILNTLKDEYSLKLHAVYIDHGLRPDEVLIEIEFCKNLCEQLDIPFITKSIDVKSYAKEQGINRQEA
ncbi:MAG: tRNA(Ile)-lysidine synthetase, partial [Nitrospirae bacterium]|nr:tRNA(Ile)-lysidine synthetase [Nitrospirota bacterium]